MTDKFRDNEERNRFELDLDGTIAFVTYRKLPGAITLVHTDVPPEPITSSKAGGLVGNRQRRF